MNYVVYELYLKKSVKNEYYFAMLISSFTVLKH